MSIKEIRDMMDNPVFKELQAKLQTAVNALAYRPTQNAAEYAESIRANYEAQYRMMYEAGLIDTMPTVTIKRFDPRNGNIEFDVLCPVPTVNILLQYAEDETENKEE